MERNNQEKIISLERAKEIVKQFVQGTINDDTHTVWIGDNIIMARRGYLIPTTRLPRGQKTPTNYIRAWVDYETGEVSMAFDLTA